MASSGSFTIKTDNSAEVLALKDAAVSAALTVIGMQAEANAKIEITKNVYDTPESKSGYIRTGRLRNSIANDHDDTAVYVGTNVEYAPYVELGTYKMPARPFLRPAIEEHLDEYAEIFKRILGNA